jgi:hypothetical protein
MAIYKVYVWPHLRILKRTESNYVGGMCIYCELTLSDAKIEEMIQNQLNTPEFASWNTTTVHHIADVATGIHGTAARKKSLQLLEEFYEWRKTQPSVYTPSTGIEPMDSAENLITQHMWLHAFRPPADHTQIPSAARAFQAIYENTRELWGEKKTGVAIFTGFVALVGISIIYHIRNR